MPSLVLKLLDFADLASYELLDKEDARKDGQFIDDDAHHMYQWFPVPAAPVDDVYDRESLR